MPIDQIYIYPTDTVWGIGCDIYSEIGFKEISRIKKSSPNKPLSILFADVEDVLKSFSFSNKISKEWLEYFFSQESTLGVPVSWAKINIPHWAHQESEYISLRCLSSVPLKALYTKIGNPFFTTSLNLQEEAPILTESDAKEFRSQFCPNAIMVEGQSELMSGTSSSMVFVNEKFEFEIKREGRKIKEIIHHINKLK
jgi:L-threonylcarbamoyladenylate synthase